MFSLYYSFGNTIVLLPLFFLPIYHTIIYAKLLYFSLDLFSTIEQKGHD